MVNLMFGYNRYDILFYEVHVLHKISQSDLPHFCSTTLLLFWDYKL